MIGNAYGKILVMDDGGKRGAIFSTGAGGVKGADPKDFVPKTPAQNELKVVDHLAVDKTEIFNPVDMEIALNKQKLESKHPDLENTLSTENTPSIDNTLAAENLSNPTDAKVNNWVDALTKDANETTDTANVNNINSVGNTDKADARQNSAHTAETAAPAAATPAVTTAATPEASIPEASELAATRPEAPTAPIATTEALGAVEAPEATEALEAPAVAPIAEPLAPTTTPVEDQYFMDAMQNVNARKAEAKKKQQKKMIVAAIVVGVLAVVTISGIFLASNLINKKGKTTGPKALINIVDENMANIEKAGGVLINVGNDNLTPYNLMEIDFTPGLEGAIKSYKELGKSLSEQTFKDDKLQLGEETKNIAKKMVEREEQLTAPVKRLKAFNELMKTGEYSDEIRQQLEDKNTTAKIDEKVKAANTFKSIIAKEQKEDCYDSKTGSAKNAKKICEELRQQKQVYKETLYDETITDKIVFRDKFRQWQREYDAMKETLENFRGKLKDRYGK